MKQKNNLIITAIIALAFLLRILNLTQTPLFGDEIDVGLQANSLIQTFKDYRGNFLPFYLQSFSESRAPLLIYASTPSIAILGLTPFAVRLTPLFFGLLSIFFLYKLILQTTHSSQLATYSALALSLTPWHIHYSRVSFELTLLVSLLLAATYYFYQQKFLICSVLFGLSFYTYNTANIFTPLLILFLISSSKKQNYLKPMIILGVTLLPLVYSILFGSASKRFGLISLFNDAQTIEQIIINRTDFSSNYSSYERFFHNKLESYPQVFIKNYLTAISPNFYFGAGDPNPRQQPPQTTLFLIPLFIPLFVGIFNSQPLFLFWFLTSPIASALTQGGGTHASRLFIMIVPLTYFIALGLTKLKKIFTIPVGLLSFISLIYFYHNYHVHYPQRNFINWQYGYDQLFNLEIPQTANLFISNTNYESLPRYAFYQQVNPVELQQTSDTEVNNSFADLSGFNLNSRTHFINNWKSADVLNKITTLGNSGDYFFLLQLKDIPGDMNFSRNPLTGFTTIKTVYYPNNSIMGQVLRKN